MNKNSGFTLAEVLIAASITLVLGVFLTNILFTQTGFFNKQKALVDEGLSLNSAAQIITNSVNQGASVVIGYPEDSPQFTTSSETLVIKLSLIHI